MSIWRYLGVGQPGKTTTSEPWGSGSEKYFGLENSGNTCYCNSILQALYFCKPFRECVLNFPNGQSQINPSVMSPTSTSPPSNNGLPKKDSNGSVDTKVNGDQSTSTNASFGLDDTLFGALKDLFYKINSQKKRTGVVAPGQFVTKLRKENVLFRSTAHQDAHEFLNYVLNVIAEDVLEEQKKIEEYERQQAELAEKSKPLVNDATNPPESDEAEESSAGGSSLASFSSTSSFPKTTWVHQLFEGILTNETKCLTCETVTSKDESFLDLSIDIEQNSSVTSCLRQFSASEILCYKNKFFCDVCCGLQEAEKRMKIKRLPNVLALHLKRFKYQLHKYIKLSYRVVFPIELRIFNTCDDMEDPDRLYELYAICVHIGSGPYQGHYVTLVKSMGQWLLFDDESVAPIDESEIQKYFGGLPGNGSGYVLFYQACDLDLSTLGPRNVGWNQGVASSSSSAEIEVSADGNESNQRESPVLNAVNGTSDDDDVASSTKTLVNDESKVSRLPPIREGSSSSFSMPILRPRKKRDHNTSDRRKSHGDHENSKDNEAHNDSSETTHVKEKEKKEKEKEKEKSTSWFGGGRSNSRSYKSREKDRDKDKEKEDQDEKDHKKSTSTGSETISGENKENSSKRDKKAEKEAKKQEKKNKNSEKQQKLTINTNNGLHEKAVAM